MNKNEILCTYDVSGNKIYSDPYKYTDSDTGSSLLNVFFFIINKIHSNKNDPEHYE